MTTFELLIFCYEKTHDISAWDNNTKFCTQKFTGSERKSSLVLYYASLAPSSARSRWREVPRHLQCHCSTPARAIALPASLPSATRPGAAWRSRPDGGRAGAGAIVWKSIAVASSVALISAPLLASIRRYLRAPPPSPRGR